MKDDTAYVLGSEQRSHGTAATPRSAFVTGAHRIAEQAAGNSSMAVAR
ncbi:hypothetical protein OIA45_47720 (plasmid) [Streptomyces chartreusis]|nr:hypothetical protein OIA45_47720 [Streptomyces chartreusis]